MPFACMLGDGPLESLVGKPLDAKEKRIGGLGLNCPPKCLLDDISKIQNSQKTQRNSKY